MSYPYFKCARRGIQFYATSLGSASCMRHAVTTPTPIHNLVEESPKPQRKNRRRCLCGSIFSKTGARTTSPMPGMLHFVSSSGSNMVEDAHEECSVYARHVDSPLFCQDRVGEGGEGSNPGKAKKDQGDLLG
ncbi:hypothetical protein H4582DRAFT_2064835 [Lactarius indigo]|nr:hypothetical protein H4582DRAFT_2064835 [Lactarius indigo]